MTKKATSSAFVFRHVPRPRKAEDEVKTIERKLGARITVNSLSKDQYKVFKAIEKWLAEKKSKDNQWLTLGGYGGTGKTTVMSVLAQHLAKTRVAFCAFTGKATGVLRRKLYEAGAVSPLHEISTLHALMYTPIGDKDTGVVLAWKRRPELAYDLLVVDEASMLDERLCKDLESYDIRILAVGDHGQLPPVMGSHNLMENPTLRLETIHRQAAESPILRVADAMRKTGQVPRAELCKEVQLFETSDLPQILKAIYGPKGSFLHANRDVAMLCYTNRQRIELNEAARRLLWQDKYQSLPQVGDQLICLRNIEGQVFNGMCGRLTSLNKNFETDNHLYGTVLFEDDEMEATGHICKKQFGRLGTFEDFEQYENETGLRIRDWEAAGLLMDFGLALTVHKSQASQWEQVVAILDLPRNMPYDLSRRLKYTAVSRCSKYLVVLQ